MALLSEQGYKVQPFKCGPDYIDTKFHAEVCGRPSVNLDTFMAAPEHIGELFHHYGDDADICIVEGMMGLFDGYDRERGSTYEIARILGLPIVLVVDAKSAAYSMAALLSGFLNFRKDISIAGIIFNKVGSKRHEEMLRQVCSDLSIRCYGCLPKQVALEQGSRYLGLDYSERTEYKELQNLLAEHVEWRALGTVNIPTLGIKHSHTGNQIFPRWEYSAVIARNADSFSFLYQETLDSFRSPAFFDPEQDVPCLDAVDLLYLPGGYPEKYAEALTKNETCRKAIRDFAEQGGHILAECGGMMYLCQSIITDDGEYPMCGVLPYKITARQADRRLSLGYRRFVLDGQVYRGHEFHYSQFEESPPSAVQVYDAKGKPVATPVLKYKNVLASYTHLYPL